MLKDIRRKVKAGETQYPSFYVYVFDHEKHTTTRYLAENDKIKRKLARVQQSIDGPKGTGVQDDAIAGKLVATLEGVALYEFVLS